MNPLSESLPVPDLSVVIAATLPWEHLQACLRSLSPQCEANRVEVIVGTQHTSPIPPELLAEFPEVRWFRSPGESVFRLRNQGLLTARAAIVAFTEDHCLPAPDWCRRIIEAHRAHPEAAAIGGVVENGPTIHPYFDWANYLIVFAPFTRPVRTGPAPVISLQANCSYKRDVLPSRMLPNGLMEMALNRRLRAENRVLFADGAIAVSHVQSHGRLGTLAAHFHNGRSIATIRRPSLSAAGRLLRIASCAVLPGFLFLYVVSHLSSRPWLLPRFALCAPLIGLLNVAHAAGELAGYVFGPGESMEKMP